MDVNYGNGHVCCESKKALGVITLIAGKSNVDCPITAQVKAGDSEGNFDVHEEGTKRRNGGTERYSNFANNLTGRINRIQHVDSTGGYKVGYTIAREHA